MLEAAPLLFTLGRCHYPWQCWLKREQTLLCALWARAQMGTAFLRGENLRQQQKDVYCGCSGEQPVPSPQPSRQSWEGMVLPGQTPAVTQPLSWECRHCGVRGGSTSISGVSLTPPSLPGHRLTQRELGSSQGICHLVPQKVWPPEGSCDPLVHLLAGSAGEGQLGSPASWLCFPCVPSLF